MAKFTLLLFLVLLPISSALAGSFELSDPAADFFEDSKEAPLEEDSLAGSYPNGLRCTVDTGTGACVCAEKTKGQVVDMKAGQCEDLVKAVLNRKQGP